MTTGRINQITKQDSRCDINPAVCTIFSLIAGAFNSKRVDPGSVEASQPRSLFAIDIIGPVTL